MRDPVDFLMIIELFERLGAGPSRGKLFCLFEKEAIARAPELEKTSRAKNLKTLWEAPPDALKRAFAARRAQLPDDRPGLQKELASLADRNGLGREELPAKLAG
jgi:hypothetical protein